jgi:hypothetical protein
MSADVADADEVLPVKTGYHRYTVTARKLSARAMLLLVASPTRVCVWLNAVSTEQISTLFR